MTNCMVLYHLDWSGITAAKQVFVAIVFGICSVQQRWNLVSSSPGQQLWLGRVNVSHPVFDVVLNNNMHVYCGIVSTEEHRLGKLSAVSVPVTALLVYLFQLVAVTFTYFCDDCPRNVTSIRNVSKHSETGSGHWVKCHRVGSGQATGQKYWPSSITVVQECICYISVEASHTSDEN